MISFVNAKINLGLYVTDRRPDGYHNLHTVFYPVGRFAATAVNPVAFCDILEIVPSETDSFVFKGNVIDCPLEKNLIFRALQTFRENHNSGNRYKILLRKYLPDGAGMGGGSADGAFTLRMLNDLEQRPFSNAELCNMALSLGADCPLFIDNIPAMGEGIGEVLTPIKIDCLSGKWMLIVKPDLHISTREAFSGVGNNRNFEDLRMILQNPIETWKDNVFNDFEISLFPRYPILRELKESLYANGAEFALLTGSGAALYGIFPDYTTALHAHTKISAPYKKLILL